MFDYRAVHTPALTATIYLRWIDNRGAGIAMRGSNVGECGVLRDVRTAIAVPVASHGSFEFRRLGLALAPFFSAAFYYTFRALSETVHAPRSTREGVEGGRAGGGERERERRGEGREERLERNVVGKCGKWRPKGTDLL